MLIIVFYLDLSFLFHIIVINFDILINCFISLEEESERELVEEREVSLDAMIGLDQVPSRLTSAQQGIPSSFILYLIFIFVGFPILTSTVTSVSVDTGKI